MSILLICIAFICVQAQDIYDSRVFNALYYLDHYPDLKAAFGKDIAQARNHWHAYGINEGRRASSDFDPQYYMSQYPDLQNAFGSTNYRQAISHWLISGINEKRKGFDVAKSISIINALTKAGESPSEYVDLSLRDQIDLTTNVENHINGVATDGFRTYVNLPSNGREEGYILECMTGEGWNTVAIKMIGGNGYPSGMQLAQNLLAVADNNYAHFIDVSNSSAKVDISRLTLKIDANPENIGLIYLPSFKNSTEGRYIVATTTKLYISSSSDPRSFSWEEITTVGNRIPVGEGGIALLYDETTPDQLICLSFGIDGSYSYKVSTIDFAGFNRQLVATITEVGKGTLAPPDGYDKTGSGASFRWGGTAFATSDAIYIYAVPKRLDNIFFPSSSDLMRWKVDRRQRNCDKVLTNSKFYLQAENGSYVTKWYSGKEYYYPQIGKNQNEIEPFYLDGNGTPLLTNNKVLILTQNTADMSANWRSSNQLTTFNNGVGYWNYGNDQAKWLFELVNNTGGEVCFDDVVRIKNVSYKQYLYPYPGKSYLWTKSAADNDTKWIIRKR